MKKILHFFILITILTFNNVFSQATPYVDVIPPVAVCNSGDCVDLLADYLETEITTTYRVESIPYLPPASFTPLSDSFVFDSSQDDRWSSTFTLPFDFCFYGQFYNQVLVGSNGLITFDISGVVPGGSQNPAGFCQWSYNQSIEDPNFPIKSSICGVYQDTNIAQPPVLNPAVQNVNYRVFGTAPTRKFIVSYNELPQYSCNDGVGRQTSQIVIYETSNVIEVYVARRTPCLGWNGGRGVIGIINEDGTLYSHPANRDTGTWTATNEAWRFVPDGGVINSQISWLANGTLIPGSVGQNPINVCPAVNTDYTAVISYTECDATIKRISETITIGPEVFPLIEPQDITICTSGPPPYTFNIDQGDYMEGGTQSGNYGYSYYNSLSDAQNFVSPIDPSTLTTYQSNGGETIWVAVEDYIGGCVFIRSFDLLAIANPSGDITYSSPNYCSNDTNLYTPTNTAPSGGQYIVTPAIGLSIDTATGEINPSLSTEGSYSIVYHLDATATCPAYDTTPFDLDIINCDCSLVLTSATNTDNQVICISDAITPIEYTVGGVATGTIVTGLPTGVSAVFSGGVVTITGTPTVTGTYNYDVETVGCSNNLILSGTITISPAPTLTSVTGNGPICEGEDAIFTIVGTPNATVSYTLDGGTTIQTVVLDASGNGQVIVTSAAVDQTIDLTQVAVGSCVTPLTDTATIVVNPLPSVTSVTGNGPICEGDDAIFDIVGTADATVSYTLDGGTTTQTVVLDASGNGQVIITAATFDQTITLSLIENTTTSCSLGVTNTATIVVNPLPSVTSVTGNGPICEGEDAIFTIVGTPNATVSYTLDGGTTIQTVVLDASGNGQVIITAATVDQTIDLTQVAVGSCVTPLTDTATIVVNPLPSVTSVTGNGPICEGEDAIFDIVGTSDATVSYTLDGGTTTQTVVLDASGNGQVIITAATVDQTITLSLIENTTTTCSLVVTNTATIVVNPLPSVTSLTGNGPICEGDDAIFTIVGSSDATVSYSLDGGATIQTVVLDASGNGQVIVTAATVDQTITLSLIEYTLTGCSLVLTNTETIVVNPLPSVTSVTGNGPICEGEDAIFTIVGTQNATVSYTLDGGTTIQTVVLDTSGNGQVIITAAAVNHTIDLSQIAIGSCVTPLTDTETIVVNPLPSITSVAGNGPICEGEDAIFDIVGTADATVSYSLDGGTTTQTVVLDASGNGQVVITAATVNQTITLSLIENTTTTCSLVVTNTETIVVNPLPSVTSLTGNGPICEGEDAIFTIVGTQNATVSYSLDGGATIQTVVLDASGNGQVIVTAAAIDQTIDLSQIAVGSCVTPLTDTETMVVNPLPSITNVAGNGPICEGEDAIFDIVGTADATVSYSLDGGTTTQTLVLDASGNGQVIITAATVNQTITLSLIQNTTTTCSLVVTNTETIVVNPLPSVTSLTGNGPICDGEDAIFTIVGTQNATVSYSLDGGATIQTVVLDASGNGQVIVTAAAIDQTIDLSQIAVGSCVTPLTDTETIVVNPLPILISVTGNGPICYGQTAIFDIVGTQNATVTYILNGGSTTQTIVLDASGNGQVLLTSATVNQTINLTQIANGGCITPLTDTETIAVNPLPTVTSLNGNGPICYGQDAVFTITGTAGAQVTYTLNAVSNTVTIPASGSVTVTALGATVNQTITLSQITYTTTITCSANLNNTATVSIIALPTATIDAQSNTICNNRNTTLLFNGTPNATVTFTNGTANYTVTLNASGNATYTTPNLTADTTYTIINVATGTTPSCSQTVTDFETITITPTPTATVTYTNTICAGTATDFVITLNNTTTYVWNATITNIDNTTYVQSGDETDNINQIVNLQNVLNVGYITMQITPTLNGSSGSTCNGDSEEYVITVTPVPVITDIAIENTTVCSGESIHLEVSGNLTNVNYNWTAILNGVVIASGTTTGTTTSDIDMVVEVSDMNQSGDLYFEITPVLGSCTGQMETSAVITVNPIPGAVVSSPDANMCSGESVADVIDIQIGTPTLTGTTVEWVVQSVTGVDGANSGSSSTAPFEIPDVLTTTSNTQGVVVYRVWSISSTGCRGAYTDFTIYVNPLPDPILEDGSICIELATSSVFQSHLLDSGIPNTSDYQFTWYFNGNVISGATQSTYEAEVAGDYYVLVQNTITNCENISNIVTVTEINNATDFTYTITDAFSDNATVTVTVIDGNGNYSYQLDDQNLQSSNVFTGISSGTHQLTVVDEKGCTYLTKEIFIIDYPKFFTPNGDGYNDYWNIFTLRDQPNAKIHIFDRYGKLIKEISPLGTGWDGTFNSKDLPSTDYWFTVEYEENQQQKVFKAHFSLKR